MKLVESFMAKNPCYTSNKKIKVEGIMLHTNQCAQPSAKVMIHNWDRSSYSRACVHAFIDGNDGTVYQTLPWNHRGWHAFGSANNTHVGIEICESHMIKYVDKEKIEVLDKAVAVESAEKTYQSAVDLCAQLCVKYNLDPYTAICSHSEGNAKGIASKRKDPEHYWTALELPYTMDTFRFAVAEGIAKINRDPVSKIPAPVQLPPGVTTIQKESKPIEVVEAKEVSEEATEVSENPKPISAATEVPEEAKPIPATTEVSEDPKPISAVTEVPAEPRPMMVRVDVDRLRIRVGPGSDYPPTGKYTGKGIFVITEVQAGHGNSKGWGKLQNGSGWISLDYVTPYDG